MTAASSHESPTLTEFVLARLADTEADARALDKELQRWHHERETNGPDGSQGSILASLITPESALHPARVLADVEAKRRIVEEARKHERDVVPFGTNVADSARYALDTTIRILATIWAAHPDYDESWRP